MTKSIPLVCLLVLVGLFAGLAAPAHAKSAKARSADVRRFALVIGSNATLDAKQSPLRFADDDAARMTELLLELGVDVELCTSLDRASQALFPDLVGRANRPTRAGVMSAYRELVERMNTARNAGATEIEFLIYYSGHGDVGPDGQGYLTLDGGKLKRHDLFNRLLGGSPATHNHVVLDACRSEEFVLARGRNYKPDRAGVDHTRAVQKYLEKRHLGSFPNTGVVLASSVDQQTHEWERYRGGVFTHELMSGMRGGADLNGDGSIEYSELGAFVSAANSGVKDPRARLAVVVRPPPDDERHPVMVHPALSAKRVLLFPSGDTHRYSLEDARGIRLADLHRSGEQPGYLRLPPGEVFVIREVQDSKLPRLEESRVPATAAGLVFTRDLEFSDTRRQARGALDHAFRYGLFTIPYGTGYYAGYADQNGLLPVRDVSWETQSWAAAGGDAEVTTTTTTTVTEEPVEPEEEEGDHTHVGDEVREKWRARELWGAVSAGVVFTPFNPPGEVRLSPKRFTANQAQACLGDLDNPACSPVRGFDVRWQTFALRRGKKYPRAVGYFRTGYTQGRATFLPEGGGDLGFEPGQAEETTYFTVPLFLGGNIYLFDNFPVRPYAGLGFGFDVLRIEYKRFNDRNLVDASLRIGFELHAGVEARITNRVALFGEVQQLWSARRKIEGVPDFSNEGLTIVTGIAIGFPIRKRQEPRPVRKTTTTTKKVSRPSPTTETFEAEAQKRSAAEDTPSNEPEAAAGPEPAPPEEAVPTPKF